MVLMVDVKKVVTFRPYKNHIADHRHGTREIAFLIFFSSLLLLFASVKLPRIRVKPDGRYVSFKVVFSVSSRALGKARTNKENFDGNA